MKLQQNFDAPTGRFFLGPSGSALAQDVWDCSCRILVVEAPGDVRLPTHVCFETLSDSCLHWHHDLIRDAYTAPGNEDRDLFGCPIPIGEGDGRVIMNPEGTWPYPIHHKFSGIESDVCLVIRRYIEETEEDKKETLKVSLLRNPTWKVLLEKLRDWSPLEQAQRLPGESLSANMVRETRKLLSALGLPPTRGTANHAWGMLYGDSALQEEGPTRGVTITSFGILTLFEQGDEKKEHVGEMVSKISQLYPGVSRNVLEQAQALIDGHGRWWAEIAGAVPIANFDLRGARGRVMNEEQKLDIQLHIEDSAVMPLEEVIRRAKERRESEIDGRLSFEDAKKIEKAVKQAILREKKKSVADDIE